MLMDAELVEFLTYADLTEKGLPPIAGGSLDQSRWFVSAMHFLKSEDNRAQAESFK